MTGLKAYVWGRLQEPSTWRGVVAAITAAGVALDPDQIEMIVSTGVGIIGVIGMCLPDRPTINVDLALEEIDDTDQGYRGYPS